MRNIYLLLFAFCFGFSMNAQIINFTSINFKNRLLNNPRCTDVNGNSVIIDINGNNQIEVSEAALIYTLDVSSVSSSLPNIGNLTGIEFFINLRKLTCISNIITSVSFANLTHLQELRISNNNLTTLDLSDLNELTYLDCGTNTINSLNITGCYNLQNLICNNNQLISLNLNDFTSLQILKCNINNLNSLSLNGCVNLKNLYFDSNMVSTINLSDCINLEFLTCGSNGIENLNLNGLINLKFLYAQNNLFTTLDLIGLISLEKIFLISGQLTSLNLNGLPNLKDVSLDNNPLTLLNVQGATNIESLNVSYCLLTTLDVSNLPNIISVSARNNQLTSFIIGPTNTIFYTHLFLERNLLTNVDLSQVLNLYEARLDDNNLETLNVKNGKLNYVYFGNNPNLHYICGDEEDITSVQSNINYFGYSTTCHVNSYCSFTPGGTFYNIQGNNKFDNNNNGCDALDNSLPNLKLNFVTGSVSGGLISNNDGNYSFSVQAGTHAITPQLENPSYFTISPTSASVTFPSTTSPFIQHFCIASNGVHHDLEIVVIPIGTARPGFDAIYKIKYKNKGNQNENATINFNYNDAILDYVSSSLSTTTQAAGTLSWNVGTLAPFQSGEILVTLNVNSSTDTPPVNAGYILSHIANIIGINTDETPVDNSFVLNQTVVNSFDPNDKTCLEGTIITPSQVGKDVHYMIRFENTGTANAQNVVVKDMIDTTKFDIATLVPIDGSHSFQTKITNTNKVEFIFENIQLPFDDTNNDGYVTFKIKTKPSLVLGNTFSNTASIYFDYNFPIITNTTTTTISNVLANQDFDFVDYFSINPNPTKDILTIQTKENIEVTSINIYNTLGQLVLLIPNARNISTVDVSSLKTGNYFIIINSDKGISSQKFIKY